MDGEGVVHGDELGVGEDGGHYWSLGQIVCDGARVRWLSVTPSLPPLQGGGMASRSWRGLVSATGIKVPCLGTVELHPPAGTSPLTGEGGRGCWNPGNWGSHPPPLIPPRKGAGDD